MSRSMRCTMYGRRLCERRWSPIRSYTEGASLRRSSGTTAARRLVHDQHGLVFEHDPHVVGRSDRGRAQFRAAGPVAPHTNDVSGGEPVSRLPHAGLGAVQKNLPACQRIRRSATRSQTLEAGEELVEPGARVVAADSPLQIGHVGGLNYHAPGNSSHDDQRESPDLPTRSGMSTHGEPVEPCALGLAG